MTRTEAIFIPTELLAEDYGLTISMLIIMIVLYCMVFMLMGMDRMKSAAALVLFTLGINWWLVESTMITGY